MNDKKIKKWVSKARSDGYSKADLEKALKKQSYNKTEVNHILSFYKPLPKKVKAVKKAGGVSRLKGAEESVLSSAIKDLQKEISRLSREKSDLRQTLQETNSAVEVDRVKQKELQTRIVELVDRESKLNTKKKSLENKMDLVTDKINRISKIKSEMNDV